MINSNALGLVRAFIVLSRGISCSSNRNIIQTVHTFYTLNNDTVTVFYKSIVYLWKGWAWDFLLMFLEGEGKRELKGE